MSAIAGWSLRNAWRLLVAGLIALGTLALWLPVAAQSGDCAGYTCEDASNFDADADGWRPRGDPSVTVTWFASVRQPACPYADWTGFCPSSTGVVQLSGGGSGLPTAMMKDVYLQPGNYRFIWRAAGEPALGLIYPKVSILVPIGHHFGNDSATLRPAFTTYESGAFTIYEPRTISIQFAMSTAGTVYFDYIWLVSDTGPTPTPWPSEFSTPTPGATAIPATAQATALPTSTPYCQAAIPTATPGAPQYQQTQPAPTATPNPADDWNIFDRFVLGGISADRWNVIGVVSGSANPSRSSGAAGSVLLTYSANPPGWDGSTFNRPAITHSRAFNTTFYVDGWAQANVVPTGATAYIEVWQFDGTTWSQAGQAAVSAGRWYNFHITVTGSDIESVALAASRSDEPDSGYIWLTDVSIYGRLARAPYCDNTYPDEDPSDSTGVDTNPDNTQIEIPTDRPCPPDLHVPNNFFGPILAGVTLTWDQISGGLPTHQANEFTTMINALLLSPMGNFIAITGVIVNWMIPGLFISIVLTLEVARSIWAAWLAIKKSIPFL